MAKWRNIFWLAVGTIIYTFLGYPLLVTLIGRFRERPVLKADITPELTLLIPAYNEEKVIAAKIENSLALDYPADSVHIAVVADGSDDDTVAIAGRFERVQLFHQPERLGKVAAVNRVMASLKGDIVVFTDANTMLNPESLRVLVRSFADPQVAGVAGEKCVTGGGEGLYWRYESYLKRCDSRLSSVMGAAGEFFAVRRELYRPPPTGALIEDFVASMRLVGDGWRVIYEPEAVATEEPLETLAADWGRRTRIGAGGFQSIVMLIDLLHPRYGMVAWQYFSHRVLRWAVTPLLLPIVFFLNLALSRQSLYRLFMVGQMVFYGSGLLGYLQATRGRRRGLPYIVFYFCFTNLAVLAGLWRYVTGRQPGTWEKTRQ